MPYVESKVRAPPAKHGHVNMMVDCVIANISADGLREVMRELLAEVPALTGTFLQLATGHLVKTSKKGTRNLFHQKDNQSVEATTALVELQRSARCWMGCGYGFDALRLLTQVPQQLASLVWTQGTPEEDLLFNALAQVDGDIVQALTAIQKGFLTKSGARQTRDVEDEDMLALRKALCEVRDRAAEHDQEFSFERGLATLDLTIQNFGSERLRQRILTQRPLAKANGINGNGLNGHGFKIAKSPSIIPSNLESFSLGHSTVPRIFTGLWQSSSPAWGAASGSKIMQHFRQSVNSGFTAFDMADHYGDAEVTFGRFRSTDDGSLAFCATKYCVFEPTTLTKEIVQENITERCKNTQSNTIGLLQFHWQIYEDHQYIQALKWLQEDPRIENLGLCNFDTVHLDEIVAAGINVVSNQVQFSLIDLRPTFRMAESCRKHNVKLLTYGSLCGGFLAESWLGKPMPDLFHSDMTPSHRKYLGMITIWGGWDLFQELLSVLAVIAKKYSVSISNVAVRWVLDHDYVGAAIVGTRMGISDHSEENLRIFSFHLDEEDQRTIEEVLKRSQREEIFKTMGDCGAEYRC